MHNRGQLQNWLAGQQERGLHRTAKIMQWEFHKPYSGDMLRAWQVVEKMKKRDATGVSIRGATIGWEVRIGLVGQKVYDESVCVAICLAALIATTGRTEAQIRADVSKEPQR